MLPIHRAQFTVFNYDEIPAGYYYDRLKNGPAVQRFWHREKFLAVAERINDGSNVLDFGCGPGSFLAVLGEKQKNTNALGVDVAENQISFAQREISPQFDKRIRFEVLSPDKKHLPYPDKSFDAITCIEVIEHIHPHLALRILQEAQRLLKPEGRLIVTTPNYRSFWPIVEFLLERLSPVKYHDQHISKFTPNSFVKFIECAGFEVKSLDSIFMISPFLAGLSKKLADSVYWAEKKSHLRLGSLLIAEAKKIEW